MKSYLDLRRRKRCDLMHDVVDEMYRHRELYPRSVRATLSPELRRALEFGADERER